MHYIITAALSSIFATAILAAEYVDARDHGCRADYERIECAITREGTVTRTGGAFVAGDAGKVLIIDGARSWPSYSLDPVPLNARISAISGGVATVESIDAKDRGAVIANPRTTAEFFTDNTDAIAAALAAQVAGKLSHVLLPDDGVIGLCPFISKAWAANPTYDTHYKTRAVFILKDGALLKGHGRNTTRLKIAYFGEFNPVRGNPYQFTPLLFMFEPVANKKTASGIESFTVEFPFSPVVASGYALVTDGWNTSPARHALQATIRDISTINPERNTVSVNSYQGGIYSANNELLEESKYVIENCEFETAGGSFKNQNPLKTGQRGGKSVHLTNVIVRGGGNIITRHYVDAGTLNKEGEDLFLAVEQKDFTWKNFNAHSDQSEGAFNPVCLVRKSHKGLIGSLAQTPAGPIAITMDTPAPVTKAGATLLINFGLRERQIYLEGAASVRAGSPVVTSNLNGALLHGEQISQLVGAEIRVYYEENLVKAVYDADSVKRIKLDRARSTNVSLLEQTGLDVTVNYEGSRGAFGHSFYVGHNINFYVTNLQIHDCAKRSFRVSSGGSNGAGGAHELIGYKVHPARGSAAFANLGTVFTATEEFGGLLKLRQSKASSVYGVVLDMDDGSTYTAQGGIYGPSAIRNSTVSGAHGGGGKTTVENSTVGLQLVRMDQEGNIANHGVVNERTPQVILNNCKGTVSIQNGVIEATNSRLQVAFQGEPAQYDQWKNAIRGTYRDCEFTGYMSGLHALSPAQRADFAARQTVVNSGVDPAAAASGANLTGVFSVGQKPYPEPLLEVAPFQLGVKNPSGVRPAHLFPLVHSPKSALYIDSRYNSFRVATPFLDDILVNAYQHGASSPDLVYAQMEYSSSTEIILVPEVEGFQLRATGKIKPATLRPRVKGEQIVLRWKPTQYRWIEKLRGVTSANIPTWVGMNGELVTNTDTAAPARGWRCVYEFTPPAVLNLSNDAMETPGQTAIYLGYEEAGEEHADEYLHYSLDAGQTWKAALPAAMDKAYASSSELQVDWLAGKLRNASPSPKQVRYKTILASRWAPIAR